MYAADFRQRARLALRTRWAPAVLTALVASLLGAELFPLDLQIQLDPTQIQQLLLNPTLVPIFQGISPWQSLGSFWAGSPIWATAGSS